MCQHIGVSGRGRPPLQSNETILEAALTAFATAGYDATSVRALNAELGLSHETITQRFGTKAELYRAAVTHGLHQFVTEFDREIASCAPSDDLELLRATVRAFMIAASHHPTLGELLHHHGIGEAERTVLMTEIGLGERMLVVAMLLQRLHNASLILETTLRELWFLAQGSAAPLHFTALAAMFDPLDGPIDRDGHIERMTDAIMRGLRADGQ
jgi:AcrR family transcriptional regulator